MDFKIDECNVIQNKEISKDGNKFHAVRVMDAQGNEFTFMASVALAKNLVQLEKCSLSGKIGGYLNGFNQRLSLVEIKQTMLTATK